MGEINQIDKEVVTFQFCLIWVHHMISKDFLWPLTLTWKCESLVVKILKSSMDTI